MPPELATLTGPGNPISKEVEFYPYQYFPSQILYNIFIPIFILASLGFVVGVINSFQNGLSSLIGNLAVLLAFLFGLRKILLAKKLDQENLKNSKTSAWRYGIYLTPKYLFDYQKHKSFWIEKKSILDFASKSFREPRGQFYNYTDIIHTDSNGKKLAYRISRNSDLLLEEKMRTWLKK